MHVKLSNTIGIEFTYLYDIKKDPFKVPDLECRTASMKDYTACYFIAEKIEEQLQNTNWEFCSEAHNDCGAIEIPSPIFKTVGEIKKFYTYLDKKIVSKYGLLSRREDTTGGGGHVHVGIPLHLINNRKKLSHFLFSLYRDMTNRPYLNWIFNDWGDNETANSLLSIDPTTISRLLKKDTSSYSKLWALFNGISKNSYMYSLTAVINEFSYLSGEHAICVNDNYDKPTIEFRIFDSKRNWQEVIDHVEFADKYISYIARQSKKGIRVISEIKHKNELKKYSKSKAIKEFNKLLVLIGLKPKRYKKYLSNLHNRYKYKDTLLK